MCRPDALRGRRVNFWVTEDLTVAVFFTLGLRILLFAMLLFVRLHGGLKLLVVWESIRTVQ